MVILEESQSKVTKDGGFIAFWEEEGFSINQEIEQQRKKVMLAGGVVAAGIFSGLLLSGLSVGDELQQNTGETVPLNPVIHLDCVEEELSTSEM